MRTALFPSASIVLLGLAFVVYGQIALGQNNQTQPPPQSTKTSQPSRKQESHQSSPAGDVGRGAGEVGKGTAKGAGAAAKGIGKGAAGLVTLHPLDAAGNVAKGGAVAGKDVGVGAAKGTGKIARDTGRGVGKVFHHHHEKAPAPSEPKD